MPQTDPGTVIYDGNCNLCTTFIRLLEARDRGTQLRYVPMQETTTLQLLGVSPAETTQGILLLHQGQRWQGTAALEAIGNRFPELAGWIALYQALPGMKSMADWGYGFLRDHRYTLGGRCPHPYQSAYPFCPQEQTHDAMA